MGMQETWAIGMRNILLKYFGFKNIIKCLCRLTNVVGFYNELRCNIVMLEYRGYGLSQGSPSERGFYMDASAAIDFILTRNDLNLGRIIVFGRSLGKPFFFFMSIFSMIYKYLITDIVL